MMALAAVAVQLLVATSMIWGHHHHHEDHDHDHGPLHEEQCELCLAVNIDRAFDGNQGAVPVEAAPLFVAQTIEERREITRAVRTLRARGPPA